MRTTLTGKNQITVPAEIVQKLGLQAGVQFDWALSDRPQELILRVRPTRKQLLERVRAIGRKFKKPDQDPIADLLREREADDELRQKALR